MVVFASFQQVGDGRGQGVEVQFLPHRSTGSIDHEIFLKIRLLNYHEMNSFGNELLKFPLASFACHWSTARYSEIQIQVPGHRPRPYPSHDQKVQSS